MRFLSAVGTATLLAAFGIALATSEGVRATDPPSELQRQVLSTMPAGSKIITCPHGVGILVIDGEPYIHSHPLGWMQNNHRGVHPLEDGSCIQTPQSSNPWTVVPYPVDTAETSLSTE
jgi:hypothetical protein